MKKRLFVLLLAMSSLMGYSQQYVDTSRQQKTIISLGADLVPMASIAGTPGFGFGGSFGAEWTRSSKTSFAFTAGYLLYVFYPGVYNAPTDDLEFLPVSAAWRQFVSKHFYLGPKIGLNVEVASPQFDEPQSSAASFFGGIGCGSRSEKKRIHPDFSVLYHHVAYGNVFSLQASIRYQFGKRN